MKINDESMCHDTSLISFLEFYFIYFTFIGLCLPFERKGSRDVIQILRTYFIYDIKSFRDKIT